MNREQLIARWNELLPGIPLKEVNESTQLELESTISLLEELSEDARRLIEHAVNAAMRAYTKQRFNN